MVDTEPEPKEMVTDPSTRIINAVAETKGVTPLELESLAPLFDPDVLDKFVTTLADTPQATGTLEVAYDGCLVCIDGDGEISVTEVSGANPDD